MRSAPPNAGDLPVGVAADDKFKNLPLARRQCSDVSADRVQLGLQAARHFMSVALQPNRSYRGGNCDQGFQDDPSRQIEVAVRYG